METLILNETSEQLFVKSSMPSEYANTGALTAGDVLRQAREAQHIELATLAAVLKISESKLRALEANDFSQLPEIAFVRGLAKSVCKRLGIDEKPVLELLPSLHGSQALRLPMDLSGRQPSTAIKKERYKSNKRSKLWWIVLAVLVIVLLFLFVEPARWKKVIFPGDESSQNNADQTLAGEQNSGSVTRTVLIPSLNVNGDASAPSSYDDLPAQENTITPPAAEPLGQVEADTSSAEPVEVAEDTPATEKTAVIAQDLRFTASGSTSITVKTSDDKVVMTRTLRKDDEVSVPLENLPLKVNVGNAKVTTVQLRGEAFDLKPYTKRNVANFEVK